jgi:hypothetical protein
MIERETGEASARCSCGRTVRIKKSVIRVGFRQAGEFVKCKCDAQIWIRYPELKPNLQPGKE